MIIIISFSIPSFVSSVILLSLRQFLTVNDFKSMATLYSMHCFSLDTEDAVKQIMRDATGFILCVVSIHKTDLSFKLRIPNLQIALLSDWKWCCHNWLYHESFA